MGLEPLQEGYRKILSQIYAPQKYLLPNWGRDLLFWLMDIAERRSLYDRPTAGILAWTRLASEG